MPIKAKFYVDPIGLSAIAPGLYTCIWPAFSNIFFSETAWPINVKFHVEPPSIGGTKVYINGPGHMTKMTTVLIYSKTFKDLLQSQKSCDVETWHETSVTQSLQSLYK